MRTGGYDLSEAVKKSKSAGETACATNAGCVLSMVGQAVSPAPAACGRFFHSFSQAATVNAQSFYDPKAALNTTLVSSNLPATNILQTGESDSQLGNGLRRSEIMLIEVLRTQRDLAEVRVHELQALIDYNIRGVVPKGHE